MDRTNYDGLLQQLIDNIEINEDFPDNPGCNKYHLDNCIATAAWGSSDDCDRQKYLQRFNNFKGHTDYIIDRNFYLDKRNQLINGISDNKFGRECIVHQLDEYLIKSFTNKTKEVTLLKFKNRLNNSATKEISYLMILYNVELLDTDYIEFKQFALYTKTTFLSKYPKLEGQPWFKQKIIKELENYKQPETCTLLLVKNVELIDYNQSFTLLNLQKTILAFLYYSLGRYAILSSIVTTERNKNQEFFLININEQKEVGNFHYKSLTCPYEQSIFLRKDLEDRQELFNLIEERNCCNNCILLKIRKAIKYLGTSFEQDNFENRFLFIAIAAECLFSRANNKKITEHTACMIACLVRNKKDKDSERLKIYNDVKRLYNLRSEFVHQGKVTLFSEAHCVNLYNYVVTSIDEMFSIMQNHKNKSGGYQIKKIDSIYKEIGYLEFKKMVSKD